MAEQTTTTTSSGGTSTAAKPATASTASSSSSDSDMPAKPLGTVDADQAAYALARQEIVQKEQDAAAKEQSDSFARGEEAAKQRAEQAADQSEVTKEEGGGLARNDLMAGAIAQTINQPTPGMPKDQTRAARLMIRAAKAMSAHSGLASLLPPADTWGLVGQGDELNGHYVLIDLESLDKVVVTERWVIDEDKVYANAQQWPKALVQGDTLKKVGA